jgi:hypothetical protein
VVDASDTGADQRFSTVALEPLDHLLGVVAVPANEHVDVIRHDRAGITRIGRLLDRLGEAVGDHLDVGIAKR